MTTPHAEHTPPSAAAREIAPGLLQIDHVFKGAPGIIASWLMTDSDDLTLIEAGPASTVDTLWSAIEGAGYDPRRIARVLVTHIHLDHAGAAGVLASRIPGARVHVHPKGAPHLIDPSRLLASAERIYGALMKPLWGDILPVPEGQVVVLEPDEAVRTGAGVLRAIDTPGHAAHHYAFHHEESGAVFTGDVAGIRLDAARYIRPPTPPPELDPDRWRSSIERLRSLEPRRLYLTHFGAVDDVEWHLDELLARLFLWTGWATAHLEHGTDVADMAAGLASMEEPLLAAAAAGDDSLAARYESAGNYRMSIEGFVRWYRKRAQPAS